MAVLSHEGTYPVLYTTFAIPVGSGTQGGYLARPDQDGGFPTVLLLPGLKGLASSERDLCRRLARRGLACLAIDLYGRTPVDPDDALEAYGAVDDAEVLRLVDESAQYCASADADWSIGERIGLLGIDVGGRFAVMVAARRSYVAAISVVYAPLTGDEDRTYPIADNLAYLGMPVLGIYGKNDSLIDTDSVDEAQRRNANGQWLLYEEAGHDFLDPTSVDYHEDAAADATERIIGFFSATLPQPEVIEPA